MGFLAPLMASGMVGILKYFLSVLFTKDLAVRVFIDVGIWLANKEKSPLMRKLVNDLAKEFEYGYDPDLDKPATFKI